MHTHFEELPNELILHIFSTYFDGVQLYKSFFGLNSRYDHLIKSINNIHLRLEYQDDDKSLYLFSTKVISIYIGQKHRSINFIPLLINVRSVTLVDPTIIQIINLLDIGKNLEHASIIWSNPYLINSMSARSFYELIFSASSCESLRSCRLYLPKSHSLYLEPKHCTLLLLCSIYVQLSIPSVDFRRIIRLCPNLIRLEIEIIDDTDSNEEKIIVLSHYQHVNIRRFHIYNLLSLDIFDILMVYIPNIENIYISMKFPSHPIDVFEHLSSIINRIEHLKEFHFHFTTDFWNLGQHQLETIKQMNPFFSNILIQNDDDEIIFIS
ncbi:unnamed protein product [Rotaria sordida]|uniref:F-box domain-containing protein n=1 Tax=Rotaria sordida TaxID=392033 RepID=A0A813WPF8_9BILA|nr:unnamed protein product [Rotaria sordida]CAF4213421.1 unnamed protein product [Rotaria sordida]